KAISSSFVISLSISFLHFKLTIYSKKNSTAVCTACCRWPKILCYPCNYCQSCHCRK
ncbi:hypothetical protein Zm00014a_037972, partial [Zea mays]